MKVDGSDMANKQAVTQAKQPQTLQQWVVRMSDQIKNALPSNITPERMSRIALTALSRDSKLASCTPQSFLGALLTSAQLGLECNTPLGQAYLLPYKNKGVLEAQFQLGYQGLIDLCYRTGQYKRIVSRVVYEGDVFDYSYGTEERLEHKPMNKSDKPIAVYGLYELKNGACAFEVMTWDAVIAHSKKYSQAVKSGWTSPWKTDPEAMAKKTVLKKVLKYAPKTVEVAQAVAGDSAIITADTQTLASGNVDMMSGLSFTPAEPTSEIEKQPKAIESTSASDDDDDVAAAFNSANGGKDFPSAEEAEAQGLEF